MALIPFEEALELVTAHGLKLGTESVSIQECVGRILAEDVIADIDFPPFDKSAMDGYACRTADLKESLEMMEIISAGSVPVKTIGEGQCSKIMTGAQLPNGADTVFMVEQSEVDTHGFVHYTGTKTPGNICYKGEDLKTGEVVLKAGTLLKPAHVAVLAGVGCVEPVVSICPTVGILVTGSELVSPNEFPARAQIRETNGYQLRAQLEEMGVTCTYYGIIDDDAALIEKALVESMAANDVVLVCGGSSVGDFDFVPQLLEKHCSKLLFEKVDIKPGKPIMFGVHDTGVCFGMPGNPVSTYVLTELLLKPYLLSSMGLSYTAKIVKMQLNHDLKIRCARRQTFLPVRLVDGGIERVTFHGSAHIHAICYTDGLIGLPKGENFLEAGSWVDVRLI